MIRDGGRTYRYGWLDKVTAITDDGKPYATYDYHIDGLLASAKYADRQESFQWDGLALVRRNNNSYINEPHPGGGAAVLSSSDGIMLNDMLSTTIGTVNEGKARMSGVTAFGETNDKAALFTGKPMVDGLGYAFLFRNYRPQNGKWLTADLIGYPDGWNNLAYCNNNFVNSIDIQGLTLYYLVAPAAVGIFGHAAAIYDLGNGEVRIVDFAGHTDPLGTGMRFSSIYEAYKHLQNDRPDDEKFWTSAFTYETTDEDTLIAFNTTKKSISNGYSSLGNNCSQVIADGVNAVGGYLARDIIPNNVVYDTVQMYMNPLIDFKYHYSFFEFME